MGIVKKKPGTRPSSGSSSSDSSGFGLSAVGGTLADSDFELDEDVKRQTIALVFGRNGEGKTTFVTEYAPGPIAYINFDNRDKEAIRKAREKGRTILRTHVPYDADVVKLGEEAAKSFGQAAVDKVVRNFEIAVRESQRGNVRTICLDTGTEYSEIVTLAVRGGLGKANDYGRSKDLINRAWWYLFGLAREGNAHLIVLARDKELWSANEPTGRYTFRGPDVMADGVDWAGQIRLKTSGIGKKKQKLKEFELHITKAGVNIEQLGEVYDKDIWDEMGGPFVTACVLQYEGSDVEDWE